MNLKEHFEKTINNLEKSLPTEVLKIKGMSSPNIRNLLNKMCSFDGCNYLEIGTWKGSTLISALYGNSAMAHACDNWSEFGGPKEEFYKNLEKFGLTDRVTFYDQNCFDLFRLPEDHFNVYLYDGGHHTKQQKMAITCFAEHCQDEFVLFVDDWNWETVQNGTRQGIEKEALEIIQEVEWLNDPDWHNGFYCALLKKK